MLDRLAQCLLLRPAGQAGRDGVEEGDPARGVRGQHRVADTGQRDAQQFALLAQLLPGVLAFDGIPDGARYLPAVGLAFDQVVLNAFLDRGQPHAFVAGARQYHDRQVRRRMERPPEGFGPRAVGQRQVQQQHIEGRLAQTRERVVQALHPGELETARADSLQDLLQQVGVGRAILD